MPNEKILGGPVKIYTGSAGATMTEPDATPSSTDWTLLGEEYYEESGISINLAETIETTRILSSTLPVKAFRTAEDPTISCNILDATVETLGLLLGNSVTTVAAGSSTIGTSAVNLNRGATVTEYALQLIGAAPYAYSGGNANTNDLDDMVWYFPLVYVMSIGQFTRAKTAQVLPVTFGVLEHATANITVKAKTANST